MSIETIKDVLLECYSKDLCYPKVQSEWDDNEKIKSMILYL